MSNENQQPTPEVEQKPSSDKVSPFLSSPLPQGHRKVNNNHYNKDLHLPLQVALYQNTTYRVVPIQAMSARPHTLAIRLLAVMRKLKKLLKSSIQLRVNTTS
jgi:hypothetical protein